MNFLSRLSSPSSRPTQASRSRKKQGQNMQMNTPMLLLPQSQLWEEKDQLVSSDSLGIKSISALPMRRITALLNPIYGYTRQGGSYRQTPRNYMLVLPRHLRGLMEKHLPKSSARLYTSILLGGQSRRDILSSLRASGSRHRSLSIVSKRAAGTSRLGLFRMRSTLPNAINWLSKLGWITEMDAAL